MSTLVGTLISRAAAAEENSGEFSALVKQNQGRVFQIAFSILADRAEAEDVAQEAFLAAYRKRAALRDPGRFRGWVNRIAFRMALNRRRARGRQMVRETAWQADVAPAIADGAAEADNRVFLGRLQEQIEELPEKLRVVMLLCAIEEMEAAEVAAVLGIPVGTVRSRLHLARRKLLGALQR